jgi:hypothetical protein
MPGILIGFIISGYTTALADRVQLKPAILTISALSALAVIYKALTSNF